MQQNRWQEITDFIRKYRKERKQSPTLKEISTALYGHPENDGNVSNMVDRMINAGWLKRAQEGRVARSLLVVRRKEGVK